MLDILVCTDQVQLQFSQNSTIWSAENPHALYESPLHSSKFVYHAQCLENDLWEHCSLKRRLRLQRPLTQFTGLLEEN